MCSSPVGRIPEKTRVRAGVVVDICAIVPTSPADRSAGPIIGSGMSTTTPPVPAAPPAPAAELGFWWRVLMPFVAVLGGLMALIVAAVVAPLFASSQVADAVSAMIGSAVILGIGLAIVRHLPHHERRRIFAPKAGVPVTVATGLSAGLGLVVVTALIIGAGTAVDPGVRDRTQGIGSPLGTSAVAGILVVFSIVVLAPLGEELLFRGVLLRGLVRRLAFWPSAVAAGVAFGACHADVWLYLFWPRFLALAITGVGLAWLNRQRGYWCGVTAHATINGLATVALLIAG
jgi:membrane protease YdiL (CAAX protease family)